MSFPGAHDQTPATHYGWDGHCLLFLSARILKNKARSSIIRILGGEGAEGSHAEILRSILKAGLALLWLALLWLALLWLALL